MQRSSIVRLEAAPWEYREPEREAFAALKQLASWSQYCEAEPLARILHDLMDRQKCDSRRRYRYGLLKGRGHPQGISWDVLRVVECNLDALMVAQHQFGEHTWLSAVLAQEAKILPRLMEELDRVGVKEDDLRAVLDDFEKLRPTAIAERLIAVHRPWENEVAACKRMKRMFGELSERAGWGT